MRCAALLLFPACLTAQGLTQCQEFTLPNGLRVRLAERHESSALAMRLVIRPELPEDPPGKEGLSLWLASLMDEGGAGPYRFHHALIQAREELGLRLVFKKASAQWSWTIRVDSRFQDQAAEQLAHAVFRPLWDRDQVEKCRAKLIAVLQEQTTEKQAGERFRELLGLADSVVSPAKLKAIEIKDFEEHCVKVLRPERAMLVLYGDLNLSQARQLALLHFGAWSSSAVASSSAKPSPKSAPTTLVLADPSGNRRLWMGAALPMDSLEVANVARLLAFLIPDLGNGKVPPPFVSLRWVIRTALGRSGLWIEATAAPGTTTDQALEALRKEWDQGSARLASSEAFARARKRLEAYEISMALHPELLFDRLSEETPDNNVNLRLPRFQALLQQWMEPRSIRSLVLEPKSAKP